MVNLHCSVLPCVDLPVQAGFWLSGVFIHYAVEMHSQRSEKQADLIFLPQLFFFFFIFITL